MSPTSQHASPQGSPFPSRATLPPHTYSVPNSRFSTQPQQRTIDVSGQYPEVVRTSTDFPEVIHDNAVPEHYNPDGAVPAPEYGTTVAQHEYVSDKTAHSLSQPRYSMYQQHHPPPNPPHRPAAPPSHNVHGHHHPPPPPQPSPPIGHGGVPPFGGGVSEKGPDDPKKIKWYKSRKFLVLAILLFLAIVTVLAVVLGVKLSHNVGNSNDDSSASPTESTSPTGTAGSPAPSATDAGQWVNIQEPATSRGPNDVKMQCPGAHNTTYISTADSPSGTLTTTYLRLCDADFKDDPLKRYNATVFEDCMDYCTQWNADRTAEDNRAPCVGVTWSYAGKQGTANYACWLKSMIGGGRSAPLLESAILITENAE